MGRGGGQARGGGRRPHPRGDRPLKCAAATVALFAAALAGAAPPARPQVEARLVVPARIAPGAPAPVEIELTIGHGWHVNAHKPLQSFLIPTVAELAASQGTLAEIEYPKPVRKRFPFADEELAVYEGTVHLTSALELPAGAAGKVAVSGTVSYQACNDSQCFAPARISLAGEAAVVRTGGRGK